MEYIRCLFYCVNADTKSIRLNLVKINYSLLWNNKGLYGLIPSARIKNALECQQCDRMKKGVVPFDVFYWHDTIKISPQIANALLGEDKDDKCTYKTKGSTE